MNEEPLSNAVEGGYNVKFYPLRLPGSVYGNYLLGGAIPASIPVVGVQPFAPNPYSMFALRGRGPPKYDDDDDDYDKSLSSSVVSARASRNNSQRNDHLERPPRDEFDLDEPLDFDEPAAAAAVGPPVVTIALEPPVRFSIDDEEPYEDALLESLRPGSRDSLKEDKSEDDDKQKKKRRGKGPKVDIIPPARAMALLDLGSKKPHKHRLTSLESEIVQNDRQHLTTLEDKKKERAKLDKLDRTGKGMRKKKSLINHVIKLLNF